MSTTKQLKEYLFARKLCQLVGKNSNTDTNVSEMIQLGRSALDRERYIRSADAHRKIVSIVGGKDAKIIFQLVDHADENNIDDAMRILLKYS